MLYLDYPHITDPRLNLALEEHLFRHCVQDEAILFIYINAPSVIVGRNQNVFEEIDFSYAGEKGIPILRRLSGGGTVYHDLGNLNYSLIHPHQGLLNNYERFTRPVVMALQRLGITAELRSRSSLFVGDRKVSGNAQYAAAGKLVSHGTLLVDCDLEQLRQVIRPQHREIESRAVKSVRSSVVNLADLLGHQVHPHEVKLRVREAFMELESGAALLQLAEKDWQTVREISQQRYQSWRWNIGRSPRFTSLRRKHSSKGAVTLEILVENGLLQNTRIIESSPQLEPILAEVAACLAGVRYDPADLGRALGTCAVDLASTGLTEAELLSLFY